MKDFITKRFSAAYSALFDVETSLGLSGNPLRAMVFELRVKLHDVEQLAKQREDDPPPPKKRRSGPTKRLDRKETP